MIVANFKPEEYELLNALEDPALLPVQGEDGEMIDEVDPRLRVIEAFLGDVLDSDDSGIPILLVQMSQELQERNKARTQRRAKAAMQVAKLLSALAEEVMVRNDIEETECDSFKLKIREDESYDRLHIFDEELVPEKWWTSHTQKYIDQGAIDLHLRAGGDEVPGAEMYTPPPIKQMMIIR